MKKVSVVSMILAIVLMAGMSGCSQPEPAGLGEEQLNAVVENILQAINTGDYQKFSRDFSADMLGAFQETQFNELRVMLQESSGNFISTGKPTLVNQEGYAIYLYPCKYDKESVIVKVVFSIGGNRVDGLFFDSTNLRAANK